MLSVYEHDSTDSPGAGQACWLIFSSSNDELCWVNHLVPPGIKAHIFYITCLFLRYNFWALSRAGIIFSSKYHSSFTQSDNAKSQNKIAKNIHSSNKCLIRCWEPLDLRIFSNSFIHESVFCLNTVGLTTCKPSTNELNSYMLSFQLLTGQAKDHLQKKGLSHCFLIFI